MATSTNGIATLSDVVCTLLGDETAIASNGPASGNKSGKYCPTVDFLEAGFTYYTMSYASKTIVPGRLSVTRDSKINQGNQLCLFDHISEVYNVITIYYAFSTKYYKAMYSGTALDVTPKLGITYMTTEGQKTKYVAVTTKTWPSGNGTLIDSTATGYQVSALIGDTDMTMQSDGFKMHLVNQSHSW